MGGEHTLHQRQLVQEYSLQNLEGQRQGGWQLQEGRITGVEDRQQRWASRSYGPGTQRSGDGQGIYLTSAHEILVRK